MQMSSAARPGLLTETVCRGGPMIEAIHLTKRYGATVAVDDLSFQIKPGQVTGFLGPNGAGKTTTMRMITGLDAPTAGSVTLNGEAYRDLAAPLTEVGALLDAKALHGGRSACNHLRVLAASNGLPDSRVDEVLRIVGLRDVAARRAGGFSLGMGQRLGIAAALLGDPGILIFDEPVNGLDPEGIVWVRTFMRELAAEGRTVLVSSHLMSEMALTADHLLVIGKGRLIAAAAMREFIDQSSEQSVLVRSGDDEARARRHGRARRRRRARRLGHPVGRGRQGRLRGGDHRVGADAQEGVAGGGLHGDDPRQCRIRSREVPPMSTITGPRPAAPGRTPAPAPHRATFSNVLRSERIKLTTIRSTWITLLVALAVGIGIGALTSYLSGSHYASSTLAGKATWDPTAYSLDGIQLAELAIAVLGVLVITSEYGTGMIRVSL